MQINQRAGLTFAAALRSILRSDPDVVMVGEIRDGETAKMAIEAALTGHFVLSTLHTNDAPGALTRLNEMGVEPFLTGAAVSAVLAQRLARKLCTHCCELYTPSVDELLKARVAPEIAARTDGMAFYRKRGCPRCNQTGYKGRIGIFQLLTMSEQLESLAVQKASREDLERAALGEGMRTLWDDGLAKVAAGLTSVEELARVSVYADALEPPMSGVRPWTCPNRNDVVPIRPAAVARDRHAVPWLACPVHFARSSRAPSITSLPAATAAARSTETMPTASRSSPDCSSRSSVSSGICTRGAC